MRLYSNKRVVFELVSPFRFTSIVVHFYFFIFSSLSLFRFHLLLLPSIHFASFHWSHIYIYLCVRVCTMYCGRCCIFLFSFIYIHCKCLWLKSMLSFEKILFYSLKPLLIFIFLCFFFSFWEWSSEHEQREQQQNGNKQHRHNCRLASMWFAVLFINCVFHTTIIIQHTSFAKRTCKVCVSNINCEEKKTHTHTHSSLFYTHAHRNLLLFARCRFIKYEELRTFYDFL